MCDVLNGLVLGLPTDAFHQGPAFEALPDLPGEHALLDGPGLQPSALEVHRPVDHPESCVHGFRGSLGVDCLNDAADDALLRHAPAVPLIILIGYQQIVYLEDVDGDVLLDAEVALQRLDDVVSLPEHLHVFTAFLLQHDPDDLDYSKCKGQVGLWNDFREDCKQIVDFLIDNLLHHRLFR